MSYTGVFSEAKNNKGENPIINDWNGLKKSLKDELEWGETAIEMIQVESWSDTNYYPERVFKRFIGFRTWEKEIIEDLNIERIGFGYSGNHDWIEVFEIVSRFSEPFVVCHSEMENRFPTILHLLDSDELGFFMLHCNNGKSKLEHIQFISKLEVIKKEE